jgi:hypothetical protein
MKLPPGNPRRCGGCHQERSLPVNIGSNSMHNSATITAAIFAAYIIYLLIEMRLSRHKIAEHVSAVFNVPIFKAIVSDMKSSVANKYEPTYRRILEQIASAI